MSFQLYYIDRGTRQVVIMNYDGSDKTVLHDARRDNTDRDHGNKYSGIAYWKVFTPIRSYGGLKSIPALKE